PRRYPARHRHHHEEEGPASPRPSRAGRLARAPRSERPQEAQPKSEEARGRAEGRAGRRLRPRGYIGPRPPSPFWAVELAGFWDALAAETCRLCPKSEAIRGRT